MMIFERSSIVNTAAVVVACLAVEQLQGQPWEYAILDLGDSGYDFAITSAISESGMVTGTTETSAFLRAYLWREPGPVEPLGVLSGKISTAEAHGINDHGWVVGECWEGSYRHPTLWRDGQVIELARDLPRPGGSAADANNVGQVVGQVTRDLGSGTWTWSGFVWREDMLSFVLSPYGDRLSSICYDINDSGTIAGSADIADYSTVPMLWRDQGFVELPRLEPDRNAFCQSVNDFDEATGIAEDRFFDPHACFWSEGTITKIEGMGKYSHGYGINNASTVVGLAILSDEPWDNAAFRWSPDEGMINLNDRIAPFCELDVQRADDINDAGQIAASARTGDNGWATIAVILTPVHPSMTLTSASGYLFAGRMNELVIRGATPGKRVYFAYAEQGGGSYIPGCTLQENALQLQDPKTLGSAVADADGVARLQRYIPRPALGRTLLLQAVVPGECAVSELVMFTIE